MPNYIFKVNGVVGWAMPTLQILIFLGVTIYFQNHLGLLNNLNLLGDRYPAAQVSS